MNWMRMLGYEKNISVRKPTFVSNTFAMGKKNIREPFLSLCTTQTGGVQCHHEYVKLLMVNNIKISMTENGDPLENAIAEKVNGIIKEEYLQDYSVSNIQQAKEALDFVITLYNEERPHNSIGNLTPNYVHENNIKTKKLWRNYYRKNPVIDLQLQD